VEHIPGQENKRANTLSRLSVTKKKSHQRSVIQIWLRHPSVLETECLAIDETITDSWMTPIIQYLEHDTCRPEEEKTMKQQCARYTMINEYLYRRGYSAPCLSASPESKPSMSSPRYMKGCATTIWELQR